jgi:hypothetical protein
MSISVILDTFKGTIDMAIQEFAKVAGAKVCEIIDEKKDSLWENGVKIASSRLEEDTEYTNGLIQQITDAVVKKIAESKPTTESTEPPTTPPTATTGGSLSKRKSKRRLSKKRTHGKSRKQYI